MRLFSAPAYHIAQRVSTLAMMAGTDFGAMAQKIRAHFYAQGSLDA